MECNIRSKHPLAYSRAEHLKAFSHISFYRFIGLTEGDDRVPPERFFPYGVIELEVCYVVHGWHLIMADDFVNFVLKLLLPLREDCETEKKVDDRRCSRLGAGSPHHGNGVAEIVFGDRVGQVARYQRVIRGSLGLIKSE